MIHRHYNPWYITNEGERAADRCLVLPAGMEHEPFHVLHGLTLSSRYHKVQMAGECDFVVLTRRGIMVMEVKGGLIGYGTMDDGRRSYYRVIGEDGKEPVKNPFQQAIGNADAIAGYLKAKGYPDVFVGHMACFPECVFDADSIGIRHAWHQGMERKMPEMILEFLEEQIDDFLQKQSLKNIALPIRPRQLNDREMEKLLEALDPEFDPKAYLSRTLMNREESDRRLREGLHVLSGLDGNRRIMVQGPPGSGKTTYALKLIRRLCHEEGKTGLYLCWNELLAAEVRQKLQDMDPPVTEEMLHVVPFFKYTLELSEITSGAMANPTLDDIRDHRLRSMISGYFNWIHSKKKLPKYDFLVADEAQDLFAKGLDLVTRYQLKDNNPMQKGNYFIFYDDRQAYPGTAQANDYIRTRDALKEASAFYILFDNLRVNTGHGLASLIRDAETGMADPEKDYGEDVQFTTYKDAQEAVSLIRQRIEQELALKTATRSDILVLLSSDLFQEDSPVKKTIAADPDLELIEPQNLDAASEKVRYTSILKSKGLEREVVILVFSSLTDAKSQFQLFVGASRGKGRVVALLH